MDIAIAPAQKRTAKVDGLFKALGKNFQTQAVDQLELTFEGIPGDFHAGSTRKSGGREPWYPRGTQMRNERQVTILARDELAGVAADMGLSALEPEWIGGNITLFGLPMLSMLPPSSLLFFEGGVTIKVDAQNHPCRLSGKSIAANVGRPDDVELALSFKVAARRRRGLTAWVEKPGTIRMGETVTIRIGEQWIYPAD